MKFVIIISLYFTGASFCTQDSILSHLDRVGFLFFMIGNLLTGFTKILPRIQALSFIYLVLYTSLAVYLALQIGPRFQKLLSSIFRNKAASYTGTDNSLREDEKKEDTTDVWSHSKLPSHFSIISRFATINIGLLLWCLRNIFIKKGTTNAILCDHDHYSYDHFICYDFSHKIMMYCLVVTIFYGSVCRNIGRGYEMWYFLRKH